MHLPTLSGSGLPPPLLCVRHMVGGLAQDCSCMRFCLAVSLGSLLEFSRPLGTGTSGLQHLCTQNSCGPALRARTACPAL